MTNPIVVDSPDGIAFFRLVSLRGMLKMERVGMKTRGGALRPQIAAEFGLNKRDSHDKFIAVIESRMCAMKAQAAVKVQMEKAGA